MNTHAPGEVPSAFHLMGAAVHTTYHARSTLDARARITAFFRHHLADTG